uniref:Protein kinase domain-containing protein n=1 Tax=Heterorhabditis bacteriophora TaxID=37862 RepID=A0A1I7WTI5_HETBA
MPLGFKPCRPIDGLVMSLMGVDGECPTLKRQKLLDGNTLSTESNFSDRFSSITSGESSQRKRKRQIRRFSDVLRFSSLKSDIIHLFIISIYKEIVIIVTKRYFMYLFPDDVIIILYYSNSIEKYDWIEIASEKFIGSADSLNCIFNGHTPTMDRCKSFGQLETNQRAHNTGIFIEFIITFSTQLGCGSFGCVYRVTAKDDRTGIYAVKVQEKARILSRNAVTQVKREASIQNCDAFVINIIWSFILLFLSYASAGVPHDFISRLYTTWQSRSKLYSVLQYSVGSLGDLFSLWRDYGNMIEGTIQIYAAELACAIGFLHRSNVIYRDLKLENIILDAEGHIQIVDFGLAKYLENGEKTGTICGTLQYMSPDVSSGNPYAHYIDWWSLGVIMHVLYTGRYPYPNAEVKHHKDLCTPVGCSSEFGNLLDSGRCVQLFNKLL